MVSGLQDQAVLCHVAVAEGVGLGTRPGGLAEFRVFSGCSAAGFAHFSLLFHAKTAGPMQSPSCHTSATPPVSAVKNDF